MKKDSCKLNAITISTNNLSNADFYVLLYVLDLLRLADFDQEFSVLCINGIESDALRAPEVGRAFLHKFIKRERTQKISLADIAQYATGAVGTDQKCKVLARNKRMTSTNHLIHWLSHFSLLKSDESILAVVENITLPIPETDLYQFLLPS